jgi:hypothetical protein
VRDVIEVGVGVGPLDGDPVLEILHRSRVVRIHAPLQVAPQISRWG